MHLLDRTYGWLEAWLTAPGKGPSSVATCDPTQLAAALKPGDVILLEGTSRVSAAIKYLTHSTWSHSALYTGPIPGRVQADGEPDVIVEAELGLGIFSSPLSRYFNCHTRICRPVGLEPADVAKLIAYAISRLGGTYDTRNVIDLMRYLLPHPPVPGRWRRKMIALGSGSPTQAICSTLIAQAFEHVGYPVLPEIELLHPNPGEHVSRADLRAIKARRLEILRIRHHSLYTPSDFDTSPYFQVIKPTVEAGFDYHALQWHKG